MVERCDYYSDDEYQYALYLEEEQYREEQEKEEFYRSQHNDFYEALHNYHNDKISLEDALAIVETNAVYSKENFFNELNKLKEEENNIER